MTGNTAHAQVGGWSAVPCDAKGNPITAYQDSTGFYPLTGTQTIFARNTYSQAMVKAAWTDPSYNVYLDVAQPLTVSDVYYANLEIAGIGQYSQVEAYNSLPSGGFMYSVPPAYGSPSSGLLNGSVRTSTYGQLAFYYKMVWSGRGTPPPPPPYLNLLLRTAVYAGANVSYETASPVPGLTAKARAESGAPFYETVIATAGDLGTSASVPSVKYRLVRSVVDSKTLIATAYINGSCSNFADNEVPYGTVSAPGYPQKTNGRTRAYANSGISAGVRQDNRLVSISSPEIDDSYHKGPYDSGLGTDRYLNKQNSDGSISTDTAAAYDRGWYGGFPFYSGDHYTASAPNFSNPVYNWTITATDVSGRDFSIPGGNKQTIQKFVDLGPLDSGFPKHSTFKVDVQDGLDSAIATNTYGVTWHLPGENWHDLGGRVEIPAKLFGASDNSQPANGFVNVRVAPDEVDWSVASHVGGGIVTTFVAVLAVLQPETDPLIIGFLTASGYTLSLATPPDSTIYPLQGSEAQFKADVDMQNQITAGNTTTVFMPGSQRILPALATQIAASGNYHAYFTGALPPGFQFSVQVYRHRFTQNRLADGYGSHGYTGPVTGSFTKSGSLEYVYSWH